MLAWMGGMGGEYVGGRFKREGISVDLWLIHCMIQQKLTHPCKAIIFQLKKIGHVFATFLVATLLSSVHLVGEPRFLELSPACCQ